MKRSIFLVLLFMILCMVGCGKVQNEKQEEMPPAADFWNWKEEGFAAGGELATNQELWVQSFRLMEEYDPCPGEGERVIRCINLGIFQHQMYQLYLYSEETQVACKRYALVRTNLQNAAQAQRQEVSVSEAVLENENAVVLDAWMKDGDTLVLEVAEYGVKATGEIGQVDHYLSYIQGGSQIYRNAIYEYLEERQLLPEGVLIGQAGMAVTDKNDFCYLFAGMDGHEDKCIRVLNPEGKEVAGLSFDRYARISVPYRMEDGELLFVVREGMGSSTVSHIWYFDEAKKEWKQLAQLNGISVEQILNMQGNEMYFQENQYLVRWDYAAGTLTAVMELRDLGVYDRETLRMDMDEQGGRRLYFEDSEYRWVVELSGEEVHRENEIRCAVLGGSASRMRDTVTLANRQNRNLLFVCERYDSEEGRIRALADLLQGEGADILLVTREDMEMLAQKGALADLNAFLSREQREGILGSVLKMGQEDGALWGLPVGINMISLLVHESVLDGDAWTPEDFRRLLSEGMLEGNLLDGEILHSSEISARILLKYSLEDDFFIDWERRKSKYSSKEVRELMRLFGKRPTEYIDPAEIDGRRYVKTFGMTGELYRGEVTYGEEYASKGWKMVGFPTSTGNGNYLEECGMLVVNANSVHREELKKFFCGFLDETLQGEGMDGYYGILRSENEEVNTLFEKCVPLPYENPLLENIFVEEMGAYYEDQKSLEKCLEIIDNRVQLYLDER